ncbi:MAG: RtcB family protein [Proteocatella sp.]
MFIIFNPEEQLIPIKVWLENINQLEDSCLQQANNLANLPFAHEFIALMPDTHSGYGMPIGGVLAADNVIVPNAVGVDIGCGMVFIQTNIPAELLSNTNTASGKLVQLIIGEILRNIPTGSGHYPEKQECTAVEKHAQILKNPQNIELSRELLVELDNALFQVGTLGSGNHFIELQTNEDGFLGLMIHSGSRNVGYKICNYFNDKARLKNQEWKSEIPLEWDLAYLPVDNKWGKEYLMWMNFALDFAFENRERMMEKVVDTVCRQVARHCGFNDIKLSEPINCHHNYASNEEHYGKMVWVHRKGAIRAEEGEWGIIPGAMGGSSYIVKGRGNPESFCSCSHGAGRQLSRTEAKKKFGVEETIRDLKARGVFLGKIKKYDVGEESRFAYKDLDFVIANELDLIEPVYRLQTLAVVKG